jgi:tetratricopeptide (TPR) repeat protein
MKSQQSMETILERAEEMFNKGNYLLALREFEKVVEAPQRDEIKDKIQRCRKEIDQLRRKDLVKRGKKHAGKKNYRKALQCFEEAYSISSDDRLKERIDQLNEHLHSRDSFQAASAAEAAGQLERAADLYGRVLNGQKQEGTIIKRACCLVRAGKKSGAAAALEDLPSGSFERELDRSTRYDYGFVLASLGRYYDCLKIWDSIESNESGFTGQKNCVRDFLEEGLYKRFENKADYSGIFEEAKYFQDSASRDGVKDLVEYCKYARIEELWKNEQFELIGELLLPYPEKMDTDLLELYAKAFYKIAELSAEHLTELAIFWLPAVYDYEISAKFSDRAEVRDQIRGMLIRKAEELIQEYDKTGDQSAKMVMACWNVEKKLVEDLHDLAVGMSDLHHLVRTPSFAEAFGLSGQILCLIRENRNFFSDRKHYLSTGAYYSPAGKSLLYLERGEYEKALSGLPESSDSEFTDFCTEKVKFEYGIHCLKEGRENPERYFKASASFFEKAPGYMKDLIDRALSHHEPDELELYEKILTFVHMNKHIKAIADALSLIMVRRSVSLYNRNQINLELLAATARKALELNPENAFALDVFNDTQVDLEIDELFSAIDKHAMAKACRIAVESCHQRVREGFFRFMNDILQQVDTMADDRQERLYILEDILNWCCMVDEMNPLINRIRSKIQILESDVR